MLINHPHKPSATRVSLPWLLRERVEAEVEASIRTKSRSVDKLTGRNSRPPSSTGPALPQRATTSQRAGASHFAAPPLWATASLLIPASYETETLAKTVISPPIHEHPGSLNSPHSSSESVKLRYPNCQQSQPKGIFKKSSFNTARAEPPQARCSPQV